MNRHATLNRFYRLVWNDRLATYVAVAETAKGRGKRSVRAGALAAVFMSAVGSIQKPPPVNDTIGPHIKCLKIQWLRHLKMPIR